MPKSAVRLYLNKMKKGNVWVLLPIGIFVVLYLGLGIGAFDVIAHLFYPLMLLISSLGFMFFVPEKTNKRLY